MSEDLKGRLLALSERNEEPLPGQRVISDEEAKERFLDLIADGVMPEPAARSVGRTPTWFKRRRNPEAANYDSYFAEAYEEIMRPDGFHREAIASRIRAAMMESALNGNVRAQEKMLAAYDPEFSFLRPQNVSMEVNVQQVKMLFAGLSDETLEKAILELERGAQKALPDIEQ